jgi:TonB family protein
MTIRETSNFSGPGGPMNMSLIANFPSRSNSAACRFFQATTLALVMTLAIPANAADGRNVKSKVSPIYPEVAKRLKIEGVVNIEAAVDADGKVNSARAVGGNPILAPAAEDAVRKWKFESGSGVSNVKVDVNFVLSH